MKTKEFSFDLPDHLIKRYPHERREQSRLLVLDRPTGAVTHSSIANLAAFLPEAALIVANDSRVRKARLTAVMQRTSAMRTSIDVLFVSAAAAPEVESSPLWQCLFRGMNRVPAGTVLEFPDDLTGTVQPAGESPDTRTVQLSRPVDETYFERWGRVPLPPYLKRQPEALDEQRYQTVYGRTVGSLAAPTAGLHFSQAMIGELRHKGFLFETITLHVGLGTFLPVRTADAADHRMHQEQYHITDAVAQAVVAAKDCGRPIVAIGTTTVRCLESAWNRCDRQLAAGSGSTTLFIVPGFEFAVVNGVLTNFHTPESTLVMMIAAFAGKERLFAAYQAAIDEEYGFFSYGDAMLIV